MIKILHYGITNKLGGIETYLYNLVKGIDKNSFKMDFLVIGKEKPCFYDELKEYGCTFYFVTPRTNNISKGKKEIREILSTNKYDILHCHCNTLSYIDPILVANKLHVKAILHSRNGGAKVPIHSLLLNSINRFRLPYKNIVLVAVSDKAGKWMFKSNEFITINNGVDTEVFKYNQVVRNKIRQDYNLMDNKVLILTGALRKQKNHKFAFQILKELLKYDSSYRLLLLGDGQLKEELIGYSRSLRIDKFIYFLGNKNNVSEFLSASDIFLFPSLYEGFPNALLEAECSGLRCFASDTITNEVAIEDYIVYLKLDDGPQYWAKIINKAKMVNNRLEAKDKAVYYNKDKKSEIKAISSLYRKIINEKVQS